MEKNLFREVYKQVCELALKDCPPSSLSGLLLVGLLDGTGVSMVRRRLWQSLGYSRSDTRDSPGYSGIVEG